MDFNARIGGTDPLRTAARESRAPAQAPRPAAGLPAVRVTLSQGPPQEASEAVRRAARRADELREMGREVRFVTGDAGERVQVEVHNLADGGVRTISLTEMLDVAAGAPVD